MELVKMSGGKYSIYGLTDNDGITLDVFVPYEIPLDDSDQFLTVDPKYHHKPSRLAYDYFGSERLAWVLMLFNPDTINDPIYDLKAGMVIRIPTQERLLSYF